jgi:putative restriction endonuclease
MSQLIFGDVPGYPVGRCFATRRELSEAGVHRPTQAGIAGSGNEGADSIVISGGYEDDIDRGDEIVYTGQGGRDESTGKQSAHQALERGNLALAKSRQLGLPVRVIRGHNSRSQYAPKFGYRYDGLYAVVDSWHDVGRSGFRIWRYRLVQLPDKRSKVNMTSVKESPTETYGQGADSDVFPVAHDTAPMREVKAMYDFMCQVCGVRLELPTGPYAEAAHIKAVGEPHCGPDAIDNVLCLCPNHRLLFNWGAFSVADDLILVGLAGSLHVDHAHKLNPDYLRYHREHYLVK